MTDEEYHEIAFRHLNLLGTTYEDMDKLVREVKRLKDKEKHPPP